MQKPSRHVLLEMLINQGVEYIFGNPGTTELPIIDAIQDHPQLKYMLALQEGVAVAMADGFARATRMPSFVNLHIAGGLANGISQLYNAYRGGTPMVLTAGQSDTRMFIEEPVLSGNLVEMCRQYTKWSTEVLHGRNVPTAIRRAFRIASTPPTGPVFLSLPWNAMDEEIEQDSSVPSPVYPRVQPDPEAIEQASRLLATAKNPLMIIGDRIAQADAVADAVNVAELLGAVVMTQSYSEVNFSTGHPQFRGPLNVDSPDVREVLRRHDVIFAVGCDVFPQFVYIPDLFSGKEQMIHLDVSVKEIEKNHPVEVGVWGDIKSGLAEIYKTLESTMSPGARAAAETRAGEMGQAVSEERERYMADARKTWDQTPIDPRRLFLELKEVLPRNAIIAGEAVTSSRPMFSAMQFNEPGSLYNARGYALGWGIGGALGIKLANPDRAVIGVVGDGAAMYSIQGLWTAAQYNIPVTFIVCSNRSYRILKHFLTNYYYPTLRLKGRKSKFTGMNFELPFDCAAIAEGFGVRGFRVDDPEALKSTLEQALNLGKPALVDIHIHPGEF